MVEPVGSLCASFDGIDRPSLIEKQDSIVETFSSSTRIVFVSSHLPNFQLSQQDIGLSWADIAAAEDIRLEQIKLEDSLEIHRKLFVGKLDLALEVEQNHQNLSQSHLFEDLQLLIKDNQSIIHKRIQLYVDLFEKKFGCLETIKFDVWGQYAFVVFQTKDQAQRVYNQFNEFTQRNEALIEILNFYQLNDPNFVAFNQPIKTFYLRWPKNQM